MVIQTKSVVFNLRGEQQGLSPATSAALVVFHQSVSRRDMQFGEYVAKMKFYRTVFDSENVGDFFVR